MTKGKHGKVTKTSEPPIVLPGSTTLTLREKGRIDVGRSVEGFMADMVAESEGAAELRKVVAEMPVLPGGVDTRAVIGLFGMMVRSLGVVLPGVTTIAHEYIADLASEIGKEQIRRDMTTAPARAKPRKPSPSSPRQKRLAKAKGKPRTRAAAKPRAK